MLHPYIHFGTIVARGSRTCGSNVAFGSLRPFGPGSNVARGSKRTRLRRFAAPVYLTNQEIMSHPYIHFGTIVARSLRTRSSNVAFVSLRPFGHGSNVARGSKLTRFAASRLILPYQPRDNVTSIVRSSHHYIFQNIAYIWPMLHFDLSCICIFVYLYLCICMLRIRGHNF